MLKPVTIACALVLSTLFTSMTIADSQPTIWLDLGYRQDSNDWTIASPTGSPDVLSELEWNGLEILQLRGRFDMFWQESLYMRGNLGYGWILSGQNRDSDYRYDNRQGEFSRSINDAGYGYTTDALIGIGKPFRTSRKSSHTVLIPMVGFSHHEQHLKMKNGLQVVTEPSLFFPGISIDPAGTRYPDLNSGYLMQWYGLWFGADMLFSPTDKSQAYIRLEYHTVDYYGEGNWNLTTQWQTPRSFSDWADGTGRVVKLGWNMALEKTWKLGLELDYQHWTTDNGTRRVYFIDNTTTETGFNGANWESTAILITIGCNCLTF